MQWPGFLPDVRKPWLRNLFKPANMQTWFRRTLKWSVNNTYKSLVFWGIIYCNKKMAVSKGARVASIVIGCLLLALTLISGYLWRCSDRKNAKHNSRSYGRIVDSLCKWFFIYYITNAFKLLKLKCIWIMTKNSNFSLKWFSLKEIY